MSPFKFCLFCFLDLSLGCDCDLCLQSLFEVLHKKVQAKTTLKGKLTTYRGVDNVSLFLEFNYFIDVPCSVQLAKLVFSSKASPVLQNDGTNIDLCLLQMWTFVLEDAVFRTNPSGQGSAANSYEIRVDKVQIVCVDAKLIGDDTAQA